MGGRWRIFRFQRRYQRDRERPAAAGETGPDRRRPAGLWLRRDHAALGVDRGGSGSRLVLEYGLKLV